MDTDHFDALGPFFHGLTHEIRNPVQGILTSAEALRVIFEDERASRLLDLIQRECTRVNQLLTDLLLLADPIKLSTESQSLPLVANETARLFTGVVIDIGPDLPALLFDRASLGCALRAVLQNAAESQSSEKRIHLSIKTQDQGILMIVTDEGAGIAEEHLVQVFEPFFTTRKHHAGLGLTIARRIVKQHGGDLRIQSELGKGTKVTIQLPKA